MPRRVAVLLAALALPAPAFAGSNEVTDLGPVPQTCEAAGKDYTDNSCTVNTRLGAFTLSPHVVHAGKTITGTISGGCTVDDGNGGRKPCPVSWPAVEASPSTSFAPAFTPVSGCTQTDYTCTWRVSTKAPTTPYSMLTVGITNEQGTGISRQYYAIIGADRFELAGHLKDEEKNPLAGVRVHIVGKKNLTLTTDATGQYSGVLPRGRYQVTPAAKKGQATFAPVKSKDCTPNGPSCAVYLIQDRTADFSADSSLQVDVAFQPGSLAADGTSFGAMAVTVTNALGDPVSGQTINVSPPLGDPPYLICSPSGRPYPTAFPNSGDVLGASYDKKTDAAGRIEGTIVAGTVSGDFTTTATVPNGKHLSESRSKTLSLTGTPATTVPDTLPTNIRTAVAAESGQAGGYLSVASPLSMTDANATQSLLLDMLVRFRQNGAVPQLQSVDFAPIHSASGGVGIEFYPHGTPRPQILKLGQNARVLDVTELLKSSAGGVTFPDSYPTLAEWEFTGEVPRGQALAGHLTHVPGEELSYFGLPYPPPKGSLNSGGRLGRNTYDEQCTQPDRNLVAMTVHSPVSAVLEGAGGVRVGTDARGKPIAQGAGLVERAGDVVTIVAPAAAYRLVLTGTGAGSAGLVFWAAGKPEVVTFRSKRGASGSATFGPTGVEKVKFAGRSLKEASALGLRAKGLPRHLRAGRRTIRLSVRDQFGTAVPGAFVTFSGAGRGVAVTDRKGVAKLKLSLRKRKVLKAKITAASFRTLRLRAGVR